jgi:serine/threonine-protein kinase
MRERAIFLAALDKAPSERAAFLDEACAGDETLRRGVETLLRLHAGSDPFLQVPAVEQLAAGSPRRARRKHAPPTCARKLKYPARGGPTHCCR